MVTVTKTFTRPDSSIAWYNTVIPFTQAIVDVNTAYQADGRYVSVTRTYPDELTNVVVQEWDTIESYNDYCNESVIATYTAQRDEYNSSNNVTVKRLV